MKAPGEIYAGLMQVIRRRLDKIQILPTMQGDEFSRTESAAFQGRKVIEGIAFACLAATKKGIMVCRLYSTRRERCRE